MNSTINYCWTIKPNQTAYEYANKFAQQQVSEEKARLVYLNTLAVLAVNEFVENELGYETDLKAGDSWNPIVRMVHDVADLVIPDFGIIECRRIKAEDDVISIPDEVQDNRIAFVAVLFDEQQLDKVKLRGFISARDLGDLPNKIHVSQLQDIEDLIDYLYQLEVNNLQEIDREAAAVETDIIDSSSIEKIVRDELAAAEESVQERLKNKSIAEIVAILENVYRNYDSSDWWNEGGKALAGGFAGVGGTVREGNSNEDVEDGEIELRDFAEELLEKLAEFWSESV